MQGSIISIQESRGGRLYIIGEKDAIGGKDAFPLGNEKLAYSHLLSQRVLSRAVLNGLEEGVLLSDFNLLHKLRSMKPLF